MRDYAPGFQSTEEEVDTRLPLATPDWLRGTLIRNGPGQFEPGGRRVAHWFDGLAMLRAFTVGENLHYRNRVLDTTAREAAERGEAVGGFGTDSGRSLPRRALDALAPPEATDNTNVHVARLGGEFAALTETPKLTLFDPETLETTGRTSYLGEPSGQLVTAHPHHDADRGETLNLHTHFGRKNEYRLSIQPDGVWSRRTLARLPTEKPAYVHSFGLTREHVIVTEFPLVVTPLKLLFPSSKSFIERYDWTPKRGTRIRVVSRETGEVVVDAEAPATFAFHHVNAFQEGGELVFDLVAFDDASAIGALYLDELTADDFAFAGGRLDRYRLALDTAEISVETAYEGGIALPRHSPKVHMDPYRYVYGQGTAGQPVTDFPHELLKVDVTSGDVERFREEHWYFSEPVFVPHPEGVAEDDGVLLAVALDTVAETSRFVVVDAQSMRLVDSVALPHVLPFDFHGAFFRDVPPA
ncbi:carotenoid oxygenase family protein [Natronomonas sp. EA1]|uniref:carotenoid oxygenase family protein n=1 Tax=Natronomonas sp. EA1 TaxID=3421655 RepID=UPI003EB99AA3